MNSILENLFYEWSEPYDLRDALLPNLNGYRDAHGEWEAAGAGTALRPLLAVLTP